jgi:predicted glycoside hydrolase/deacetylase ChbG (UPF0249 family)
MPRLILCADDFGLSSEISAAIVKLAAEAKINAISCMAICAGWAGDSALLRSLPDSIEIGLHLVLTGEPPLTPMPGLAPEGRLPTINQLAQRARRKQLSLDEVRREISAQFDRFIDEHGRPPAFVDGHQHAHVLPGIRQIVLAETARRAPDAWLRNCVDRLPAMLSRPFRGKALANAWHSRGLKRDGARHGLSCNDSFGGHYDFARDYAGIFPQFLARSGAVHLVMCHPGAGDLEGDPIAAARKAETAALQAMPMRDIAARHGLQFLS